MAGKGRAPTNLAKHWLHGFIPEPTAVNLSERVRACCGALLGILLTGLVSRWLLGPNAPVPLLVAPMGASAVLLFALPASPLAQPWSIIGGNLVAATLGVTCALWIADPILAAALAIASSIFAMLALRCLHPPSGAVALTAVLGGPVIHAQGYHFLLVPIGVNSLIIVGVALIFNNLTRHRYPHTVLQHDNTHLTKDRIAGARVGFTSADLDLVLARYNQVLDVSRDDLESLLLQTEMQAYRRRFGEITCADIMSRDVVSVQFGTELQQAWELLNKHQIKALPVVDTVRRVIGIVTLADFLKHAGIESISGYQANLKQFLRRTGLTHTERPEVVGQIMTRTVRTVTDSVPITELVDLITDHGHRHVPVINDERRLVGIVTNSDLVAGLYRARIVD